MARDGMLIEAEQFDDKGGWVADTQFANQMGSAYLMAHGLGFPVADASTSVDLPEAGDWKVWVRTKDWVPGAKPEGKAHPGAFEILIDGHGLDAIFGADGQDWHWAFAGSVELEQGITHVSLHDLTGFDGRCDAIYLTLGDDVPPEQPGPEMLAWRKGLLGIPDEPKEGGSYDLVVVGGGCPGATAAYTAAKLGLEVALIQDRPTLGGNASAEVGLEPRGEVTPLTNELFERPDGEELAIMDKLESAPSAHVFYNSAIYAVEMEGGRIAAVLARDLITGVETRYEGAEFVDASGTAALALLAGAETMEGREGRAEYGESLAPLEPDAMHHGNTLLFHTVMRDEPVDFSEVPWALDVAKSFDDLNGQMGAIGEENQPGPCPSCGGEKVDFSPANIMHYPATHFWEYGQFVNMYEGNAEEEVRDHLMRALYGTLANVRAADPVTYGGLVFEWLHHVPARGEYKRIKGDHILTEPEVRAHADLSDAIVRNDSAFCLHYPGDEHDFRLGNWIWDIRDMEPYWIPFGSLYSTNVPNLMMAGKVISTSRVVGTNVKMSCNGAQHGIAVGAAAALCKEHGCDPRDIRASHMDELRDLVAPFIDQGDAPKTSAAQAPYIRAMLDGAIEQGADPTQPEVQAAIAGAVRRSAAAFDEISSKNY